MHLHAHLLYCFTDGGEQTANVALEDAADSADAECVHLGEFARINNETLLAEPPIKLIERDGVTN